ncbi:hypothetical protein [Sphingobacterium faecium]|uniref:hypothetical protein n=1 Tax=Sphingobacterium faecium TaxID=34087 RepID=UPI0024793DA4|nr:hypothetical protein [Sphingobacterium faecium]WGQ12970.1 hypothetical protein QG727_13135 [Sphingobacterium faecium]
MRRLLVVFFALFILSGVRAQQFKIYDGDVIIDTIVNSENTKLGLFSNAVGFVSTYFKDTKATIDMKDLELGEFVFSGYLTGNYIKEYEGTVDKKGRKEADYTRTLPLKVGFTCHLYLKDKKFKVVLKQLDRVNSLLYSLGTGDLYPFEEWILESDNEDDVYSLGLVVNFIKTVSKSLNEIPENEF